MNGRRVKPLFALMIAGSLLLNACASGSKETAKTDTKGPTGTFVYSNVQDAKFLNPILATDVNSPIVLNQVFDGLMAVNEKAELKPNLAKSWEVAGDSLTLTFHLRDDVKWHDGEKFTAKDVAFTYNAIMHPDYTGPRRTNYLALKGVKAMDEQLAKIAKGAADRDQQVQKLWEDWVKSSGAIIVKDDYTVEFHLDEIFAPIMAYLTQGLIPEHLYRGTEGQKLANSEWNQKPVGTGPMKFVEWKKGDSITLVNNPDYKWGLFQKPFNFAKFIFKVVPDSNVGLSALESGEVDFANIDADSWDKFTKLPNIQTFEYVTWGYQFVGYNFHEPMLQDKRVRQALTSGFDREAIVKDLLLGHGKVAHTHTAFGRWDYTDDVKKWPYDPALANKLLDEAGWKMGADGIRAKDGKKLALTFSFSSGVKTQEQIGTIVQQSWKKIGVDTKLEAVKFEALLDKMQADTLQAFIGPWSLGIEPDAYQVWHTDGGFKWVVHYSNPEVDRLMVQGRTTLDQAKRKDIYVKAEQILAEEQPYTWLYFTTALTGFSKRVKGIKPSAAGGVTWNMQEWTVEGN